MSIRVMAAAVATAAGLALAFGGLALSADAATTPGVQLTGTHLRAALLPASDFPAGYKLEKSSSYDSGSHLLTAPAKYNLATQSCSSFAKTFGRRGYGETAVAADAFSNGGSALETKLFGQQVYQFKTSRVAAGFYSALRAIVHRCPRFAFIGVPASAKVTTKIFDGPSIGGHKTFEIDQSGTISGFKLGFKLVFTVAGQDLFFTGNIGVLTAPPTSPSPRTTMLRLINRVSAFR
jgi:hypothetical protein